MSSLTFEDILLCDSRFVDPEAGGLWWCKDAADVMTIRTNAVCLASLAEWENVKLCKDWLSKFRYIFVASPDRELVEQVRKYVNWSLILSADPAQFKGFSSVAEFNEASGGGMAWERLILKAKVETSPGLINLAAVKPRDYTKVPRTVSGFPGLDKATGGFRAGELTVWTGKRGEGKSTILGQVLCEAVDQEHKVCAYSGELVAERFKDWILLQAAGPNHLQRSVDPKTGADSYFVSGGVRGLIDEWWDGKFFLYDIGTSVAHDENSIIAEFEYAHRILGCDVFLVDNVMTARLGGDRDYYRAQSLFTQRLAQFAKANQVHVHLVAHPRKVDRGKFVDDADEVSGTGDITNLADNVLSMRRLEEKGVDGRDTELTVLKARESGIRGRIGLCYEPTSRRFYAPFSKPDKRFGWEKQGEQVGMYERGGKR